MYCIVHVLHLHLSVHVLLCFNGCITVSYIQDHSAYVICISQDATSLCAVRSEFGESYTCGVGINFLSVQKPQYCTVYISFPDSDNEGFHMGFPIDKPHSPCFSLIYSFLPSLNIGQLAGTICKVTLFLRNVRHFLFL